MSHSYPMNSFKTFDTVTRRDTLHIYFVQRRTCICLFFII